MVDLFRYKTFASDHGVDITLEDLLQLPRSQWWHWIRLVYQMIEFCQEKMRSFVQEEEATIQNIQERTIAAYNELGGEDSKSTRNPAQIKLLIQLLSKEVDEGCARVSRYQLKYAEWIDELDKKLCELTAGLRRLERYEPTPDDRSAFMNISPYRPNLYA